MTRVLVTDAGRGSAVSIIRSLGRSGHQVVAAAADRLAPGLFSRWTGHRVHYPAPERCPDEYRDVLRQQIEALHVDLVIPVTDEALLPLATARSTFDGLCELALPPTRALDQVRDKRATLELARSLEVPVPRSVAVTDADQLDAACELGWPVVIKPQQSRVYTDGHGIAAFEVGYATDRDELARILTGYVGVCPVLAQEYVAGEGHGVELLLDRGRALAAFQHRRLREVPVTGGVSSFRESVALDPTLLGHSLRLLGALEWTGLAMVEFKLGADGGRLMEINGRVWGSLPLAVRAGMDFPAKLVDLHLGGRARPEDAGPDTRYEVGVRSRNLELELVWIASVLRHGAGRSATVTRPRRREAVVAAARLAAWSDGYDVMSWSDPRPGLAELVKIGRRLARKVPAQPRSGKAGPAARQLGVAVARPRAHAVARKARQ